MLGGGGLLAPHTDAERVTIVFKEQHNIDQFSRSEQIAWVGVPVDVSPGGNHERELACGHHSSADRHTIEVWEKTVGDVQTRRGVVVPVKLWGVIRSLQNNPVGVVDDKGKRRIFHDSTFGNEPAGPRTQRGGKSVGLSRTDRRRKCAAGLYTVRWGGGGARRDRARNVDETERRSRVKNWKGVHGEAVHCKKGRRGAPCPPVYGGQHDAQHVTFI